MSLRSRLLLAFSVVAFMLVLADVVLAQSVDRFLLSQVDGRLESASPPLMRGGRGSRPDTVPPPPQGHGPDEGPRPAPAPDQGGTPDGGGPENAGRVGLTDLYIETRAADGSVMELVSPGLRDNPDPAPRLDIETIKAHATRPVVPFTVPAVTGSTSYRVRVDTQPDGRGYTIIGLSLREMTATWRRVVLGAGGVTLAVLLLLAVVAWWVLRLGVRPLGRMATTAENIATGDLSHRVDVKAGARTEVGRLASAFNTMLSEIEIAFSDREASERRLRRFVADASHELRTPLTSIRGYAELYRQGGFADRGALDDAMRRIEKEAVRMGLMVEDLLVLARIDQGRPIELEPVRLDRVVADAVTDARAVEPDRPIGLHVDGPITVVGDENRLRQVASNLLANVSVHTPPGTPAQVRLDRDDTWARLVVEDEGPGIAPAERERVFERFYRADPSRARRSGGSGLGLSIVAAIAEAHGGRARAGETATGGTAIVVEFPLPDQQRKQ